MKPKFEIVDAKPWHCGQMCRLLRVEHHRSLAMIGADVHRELRARFDESSYRKAWLIDGRLAALGGMTGTAMSAHGLIWMALSHDAMRFPLAVVKEARRQIDMMMMVRRELATMILGGDETSRRFAVFLGFRVDDQAVPAFSKQGRRALLRHIDSDPDLRIPLGKGYAIGMGYKLHEAA